MRLIDADNAKAVICKHENRMSVQHNMIFDIEKIPTIEAEPVKHGQWIQKCDSAVCSVCGDRCYSLSVMEYKYCPTCGAKMDEEVTQ